MPGSPPKHTGPNYAQVHYMQLAYMRVNSVSRLQSSKIPETDAIGSVSSSSSLSSSFSSGTESLAGGAPP